MGIELSWLPRGPRALVIGFLLVSLLSVGVFVVSADSAVPDPVPFEDTRSIGFASEVHEEIDSQESVPRAQVFYSQYQYVIGYYGIETAAASFDDPAREQQFGYPIVTYVSDYADTGIELTAEEYIETDRRTEWVFAQDAVYVVDSDARTPAGSVAIPFADQEQATEFTDTYGGEVVSWDAFTAQSHDVDDASLVRDRVDSQGNTADERVADRLQLLDRPAEITVSPDDDLQTALDAATAETTVVLDPGTYEGPIDINESVTLRGHGATVEGDENGSVININAADVAVDGITVTGVGDRTRNPDVVTGDDDWDTNIELGYGHGDAAIAAVDAPGTLVTNVTVPHTDANGILLRDSNNSAVHNVTVTGTEVWRDSFMGVMIMRSSAVVEDSQFTAGRDGIYLHRSPETVIRNNDFRANRYGVHLMHTSDAMIADNTFADQEYGGVTIMTSPSRNAIVGNIVANTSNGISTSGSYSYIAHNVAVDTRVGITTSAVSSLYEHNVVRENEYGMRTGSVLATSTIHSNDFVGNDQHAGSSAGPLRIWADGTQGNYWEGAYGDATDGTYDRAYSPTDPVDGQLHRSTARTTVAESPVTVGLRALQGSTPGLRSGSILDPYPQTEPQNPQLYEIAEAVSEHGIDAATHNTTDSTDE
ncbi:right-handed parallel beta-helix repeat-containing protein [Halorubraceae archaeon YAN]|nr:right-handed parallel beta-helix repeat-containing protein [Halorubraceae archaeon YAN]